MTYEVQWGTDTFAMFQSVVAGKVVPYDMLVKDVPKDKADDLDFIISLIDWDANVNPYLRQTHFLPGKVSDTSDVHEDKWVIYGLSRGEDVFSAKQLTVQPGGKVTSAIMALAACWQCKGAVCSASTPSRRRPTFASAR